MNEDRIGSAFDWEIPRDAPVHVSLWGLTAAICDAGISMDRSQLACVMDFQPEESPPVIPWRERPLYPTRKQIGWAKKILHSAGYDVMRRAS